jgi:hypothetical protein
VNPQSNRPIAVTVVAWLIIAKAAWIGLPTLLYLVPSIRDEAEELLQMQGFSFLGSITWSLSGAAVRAACGMALLTGRAWGRLLYFIYVPFAYVLSVHLYGIFPRDLWGLLVFSVFVILLTRPQATWYFRRRTGPKFA